MFAENLAKDKGINQLLRKSSDLNYFIGDHAYEDLNYLYYNATKHYRGHDNNITIGLQGGWKDCEIFALGVLF